MQFTDEQLKEAKSIIASANGKKGGRAWYENIKGTPEWEARRALMIENSKISRKAKAEAKKKATR
jgi:hypothetical protein